MRLLFSSLSSPPCEVVKRVFVQILPMKITVNSVFSPCKLKTPNKRMSSSSFACITFL